MRSSPAVRRTSAGPRLASRVATGGPVSSKDTSQVAPAKGGTKVRGNSCRSCPGRTPLGGHLHPSPWSRRAGGSGRPGRGGPPRTRSTSTGASAGRTRGTRLAGWTAPAPNRRDASSTACSASRHPRSGRTQEQLAGVALGLEQPLHPDPDQPDPGSLQPEGPVESERRLVDGAPGVGGLGERLRAGQGGEVGEAHLDADGAAEHPVRAQPGRGALGEPQQLATDHLGVVDVPVERLLRPGGAVRLVRGDPALVPAPRQRREVRARPGAERPLRASRPGCGRGRRRCAGRAGPAAPPSSPPPPTALPPAAGAGRR